MSLKRQRQRKVTKKMTNSNKINTLKQYIRSVLSEDITRKKLRVFDFDDTLAFTSSKVFVNKQDGTKLVLTAGEFATYVQKPGDVFDFSDFNNVVDPKEIKWTTDILRRLITKDSDTFILTARAHQAANAIRDYLNSIGLSNVRIVTLENSDPKKKSDYIAQAIDEKGYNFVEFFDDSKGNIDAVAGLKLIYPNVKFIMRHVAHKPAEHLQEIGGAKATKPKMMRDAPYATKTANREQIGSLGKKDKPNEEELSPHLMEPEVDPEDCWGPVPPKNPNPYATSDPFTQDYGVLPTSPIRR